MNPFDRVLEPARRCSSHDALALGRHLVAGLERWPGEHDAQAAALARIGEAVRCRPGDAAGPWHVAEFLARLQSLITAIHAFRHRETADDSLRAAAASPGTVGAALWILLSASRSDPTVRALEDLHAALPTAGRAGQRIRAREWAARVDASAEPTRQAHRHLMQALREDHRVADFGAW